MGLANLVPGISGGTMLLAAGVYPQFIAAIGEVTTLTFRRASVLLLGVVVAAALASIILLAGPVKDLVVHHRWIMYSLFIGLTLGGVPVVWRLITDRGRKPDPSVWIGAAVGFLGMAGLAVMQTLGSTGDVQRDHIAFMFLAGIAGASAMILPGVSGGYLLLVLGVYVPILAGVDAFKEALKAGDTQALIDVGLTVVLPVGVGVVLGVVAVSNLLRWLLNRHETPTLGVLLGLLLGAVVGLWPFQQATTQDVTTLKGQAVSQAEGGQLIFTESGETVDMEDLPTAWFSPSAPQVGGALGLIVLGFGITLAVDRLGRDKPKA